MTESLEHYQGVA